MSMKKVGSVYLMVLGLLASGASASVTTYFSPADISDDGSNLIGSAVAKVTTGAGYIDVAIQNTSPLGQLGSDWATPFITELELTFPDGLIVDTVNSQVNSAAGSSFGQGAGVSVLYSASAQLLNYNVVDPDTAGMKKCLMSYADAVNNRNDNTIASANMLNGSMIPLEDRAVGFLNPDPDTYSGAVFDEVVFHIEFTDGAAFVPESYYAAADTLVVKYQGGGDYSYHAYNVVPEPASIGLLGVFGLLALVRRRFYVG